MSTELRLRPLREDDEAQALEAHRLLLADNFLFLGGYDQTRPWAEYVRRLELMRRGVDVPEGWVPTTYLMAVVGDRIVGRTSIRHQLNEFLAEVGGHIGYGVVPEFRRQGYATEILRQSLIIAQSEGVDRVLVTCDEHNAGSAGAIENCGGVLESIIDQRDGGPRKKRYWID